MLANQFPYSKFNLITDMIAAAEVIRTFDTAVVKNVAQQIAATGKLLISGEGSSRMFPAKSAIAHSRRKGWNCHLVTEGGRQSQDYALDGWATLGVSNSGRTAEVIRLFQKLKSSGNPLRYSLTALPESTLESLASSGHVLHCGKEVPWPQPKASWNRHSIVGLWSNRLPDRKRFKVA